MIKISSLGKAYDIKNAPPPGLASSSARHPSRPAATEPTCSSRSRTTCSRSEIQHSPPRSSPGEAFSYPPVPNCLPRTHPSFFAVSSPVPPPVACPCAHFVFLLLAPRLPFALPSLSNCFVAACPSFSHLSCCICMFSRLVPSGLRLSGAAAPVLVLRVGFGAHQPQRQALSLCRAGMLRAAPAGCCKERRAVAFRCARCGQLA